MTDETRARFLAAIAKQVAAERVVEVHIFPAIRQGGVESGVAVIAVEREGVVLAPPYEEIVAIADEAAVDVEILEVVIQEEVQDAPDPESPYADDAAMESQLVESEPVDVAPVVKAPASRYTVYSALYRHTLKGLERGKWEVSVTEEADAPLLTIDAVVRGVERRSGEADDTVRLSGDEFRAALPIPVAQSA